MNNDNKVETAIAGLNFWANYATGYNIVSSNLKHSCCMTSASELFGQSDNTCKQACDKLLTAFFKFVTTARNKQGEHNFLTACE